MRALGVALVLLLAFAGAPSAQQEDEGATAADASSALNWPPPGAGSARSGAPFDPMRCTGFDDGEVRAACRDHAREYFAYLERQLAHRSSVFSWQHVASRAIFVMVMALVTVGVYFAWRQFARGEREAAAALRGGTPEASPVSSVELGMGGIKVSSTVLGIVILALSLGFFYLYLVHVFPISEVL